MVGCLLTVASTLVAVVLSGVGGIPGGAQDSVGQDGVGQDTTALDLHALPAPSRVSRLEDRFGQDRSSLRRFHRVTSAPETRARLDRFYGEWLAAIDRLPEAVVPDGEREELSALRASIAGLRAELAGDAEADARTAHLVPFASVVEGLALDLQAVKDVDSREVAGVVDRLAKDVRGALERFEEALPPDGEPEGRTDEAPEGFAPEGFAPELLRSAADRVERLRAHLTRWHGFYDGYDPLFSWWLRAPYAEADAALEEYAALLKEQGGEADDEEGSTRRDRQDSADSSDVRAASSNTGERSGSGKGTDVPDLEAMLAPEASLMSRVLTEYQRQTRGRGGRRGGGRGRTGGGSPEQRRATQERWLAALEGLDFSALSRADRVDWLMLVHSIRSQLEPGASASLRGRPEVMDDSGIPGRPIGAAALSAALRREMIDHSPEELFEIGRREMTWCRAELVKAAREMGHGDDWRAAVEKVKGMHVDPGEQPRLIHDLAWEAIDYLRGRDLLTIPPLAAETWGMQMMSPERQLVNPFFTGGPVISVSFPTDTMSHDAKLQSLRGNNVPFARATVHHELIPGHNLQLFMNARHATHRRPFASPFWLEGWALYWEMRLYDFGFPATPEDRVGFLVWRSHRCARIVFSLGFHLGRMLPGECVDHLVENVGFDRKNAEAEVRRSFGGGYSPLYQAAYMLGGLQLRQLHREQVVSGRRSEREFHDAVMRSGSMPIKMLRLLLGDEEVTREGPGPWRFYGEL